MEQEAHITFALKGDRSDLHVNQSTRYCPSAIQLLLIQESAVTYNHTWPCQCDLQVSECPTVRVMKEQPIAYRLVMVINREGTYTHMAILPGLCTSHNTMELKTRLNTSFCLAFSIASLLTFCFPVLNSSDMPSTALQRALLLFVFSPVLHLHTLKFHFSPLYLHW